jgi:hypothetical protein
MPGLDAAGVEAEASSGERGAGLHETFQKTAPRSTLGEAPGEGIESRLIHLILLG